MVYKKRNKIETPHMFAAGFAQAKTNNVNEVAEEISKAFQKSKTK
ncbi:MAG: hypothetical protein PHT78_02460 [Desulfitobacteriaceae bacterium]|nr:hypothetical protein [Desulfitobacteriaceae bacterium]MDD4752101.1 hypothetical protein [Desulfitobacteriaceae bacterium]